MFSDDKNITHHGFYIHRISHDFSQQKNKSLRKYNLTDSQIKVLYCLWKNDKTPQTEIQKKINIKASSLTRLLDTLEKKQFIKRTSCNKDSRVKLICLTDKGRLVKKDAWEDILFREKKLTKGFSDKEKEVALSFLKRMLANISTEGDD